MLSSNLRHKVVKFSDLKCGDCFTFDDVQHIKPPDLMLRIDQGLYVFLGTGHVVGSAEEPATMDRKVNLLY